MMALVVDGNSSVMIGSSVTISVISLTIIDACIVFETVTPPFFVTSLSDGVASISDGGIVPSARPSDGVLD